ncbi:hypothetical protein E4J89_16890 [Arthrobacter sp. CAU 1506]|uniref:IclR family transcriptional regulator n=1 Tax=Arthrobacter sp. CAU 1506 TaxID=2560052 RepID=UPI0010AB625E|nr:helix-turn-helix domain-containing protein [Arthrobacter sp. CAU 1506]TJY66270.1 hypothetical protein E4J89_16890 [Arthrobacter sp. CAU 1506]
MTSIIESSPSRQRTATGPTVFRVQDTTADDSVLGKVHLLLRVFSPTLTRVGLTELSRRSGIPKATTYRLASQLVDLGYLSKTGKEYQLGWKIFEMGQLVTGPARLSAVARPTLIDLRSASNALIVHLAIARGNECVYLERIVGRREVPFLLTPSMPILSSASGRVLMAYRDSRRQAVTELVGREKAETALAQLETIRSRRWASDNGELVPGLKTYAVPIALVDRQRVPAVISVTVPADRKDDQTILHALWSASADVGRSLDRR